MEPTMGINPGIPMSNGPRSIDFHNPGTVEHVIEELRANLAEMYEKRAELVKSFNEQQAQFQAVHDDYTGRIIILEKALSDDTEAAPAQAYATRP